MSVIRGADVGLHQDEVDAETAPLRDPWAYQYEIDMSQVAEVWRRGSVISSWLVDLTAAAFAKSPELEEFSGRVSDSGEGRWTVLGRGRRGRADVSDRGLAVRAVRDSRDAGEFHVEGPVRAVLGVRRAPGEEGLTHGSHERLSLNSAACRQWR